MQAQRSLVADASHELRTPIASLRANIQMLEDADRLPASERENLRADIIEELDALTALVGDVVELARGVRAARERRRRGARQDRRERGRQGGPAHPRRPLPRRARADAGVRLAGTDRPGGREPARQRRQVEPSGRRRGGRPARWRAVRSRSGPGFEPKDLPHVFDASTGPRRPAVCRGPDSASRSCVRPRKHTAVMPARRTTRAAEPASRCSSARPCRLGTALRRGAKRAASPPYTALKEPLRDSSDCRRYPAAWQRIPPRICSGSRAAPPAPPRSVIASSRRGASGLLMSYSAASGASARGDLRVTHETLVARDDRSRSGTTCVSLLGDSFMHPSSGRHQSVPFAGSVQDGVGPPPASSAGWVLAAARTLVLRGAGTSASSAGGGCTASRRSPGSSASSTRWAREQMRARPGSWR